MLLNTMLREQRLSVAETLSGKVGGMKDFVVICLQLGVYYSADPRLYAA